MPSFQAARAPRHSSPLPPHLLLFLCFSYAILIPIHQSQQPISSPFRYNDFQHDPLGKCNCTPPYSGENGISARSDLNPANGTYPFSALGHRSHGGTDNKVSRRVGKKMSWCWRCAVLLFTNLTTLVLMILCVYMCNKVVVKSLLILISAHSDCT